MTPEPLVVGVLADLGFDEDRFRDLVAASPRPLEVLLSPYREDTEIRRLKRRGGSADAIQALAPPLDPQTADLLDRAEVVLALDVPLGFTELARRLRWLQGAGAGIGQFDEPALWARGVTLTNAAGVGAPAIAEFAMGRILQVMKDFRGLDELQRQHTWSFHPGRRLVGKTLGVVGLGAIGSAVARRAKAFDMRVVAVKRHHHPGEVSPVADVLYPLAELDRLLAESDVVLLSAPATPETDDLIGEHELTLLHPGAVLCNVARGSLVDEVALVAALEDGRLGAAILDVTRHEPPPPDDPLWEAPNLYLSPHSSTSQDGYVDGVTELFARNLLHYMAGEPLDNVVTADKGY